MRIILFLTLMIFTLPANASTDPVEGYWLTQNQRAVVKLAQCDQGLCGSIYWIIEGGLQADEHNPDESKRANPICGMNILWGFEQQGAGEWEDGKIYKADEGDLYDADLEIEDDGTLRLRGYIGTPLLGKTQIWTRVAAEDYKACK